MQYFYLIHFIYLFNNLIWQRNFNPIFPILHCKLPHPCLPGLHLNGTMMNSVIWNSFDLYRLLHASNGNNLYILKRYNDSLMHRSSWCLHSNHDWMETRLSTTVQTRTYFNVYKNSLRRVLMLKAWVTFKKNKRSVIFVLIDRSSGKRNKTLPNLLGWPG